MTSEKFSSVKDLKCPSDLPSEAINVKEFSRRANRKGKLKYILQLLHVNHHDNQQRCTLYNFGHMYTQKVPSHLAPENERNQTNY